MNQVTFLGHHVQGNRIMYLSTLNHNLTTDPRKVYWITIILKTKVHQERILQM